MPFARLQAAAVVVAAAAASAAAAMAPVPLPPRGDSSDYPFDPRIHNVGNVGWRGRLHALVAPAITRYIDHVAYEGADVRTAVLDAHVRPGDRVVDLCCGTGTSTRDVGVDTSAAMLDVARLWRAGDGCTFVEGNAETWRPDADDGFDVATCMFAMHEMPRDGRRAVLRNLLRLAPVALVVDISPDYPAAQKPLMLLGEPYILEYQAHMDEDAATAAAEHSNCTLRVATVVERHVTLWALQRT